MGGKEYTIDCSKMSSLPAVEITLGGGKKFTLEGKDYVLQVQGQCLFAFMPIELPPKLGEMWILGDVFMQVLHRLRLRKQASRHGAGQGCGRDGAGQHLDLDCLVTSCARNTFPRYFSPRSAV